MAACSVGGTLPSSSSPNDQVSPAQQVLDDDDVHMTCEAMDPSVDVQQGVVPKMEPESYFEGSTNLYFFFKLYCLVR